MKLTKITAVKGAAVAASVLLVGGLAGAPLSADASRSSELRATGLAADGTRLVRFDTARPGLIHRTDKISGLQGDRSLVGIDYRVQNGRLYGVGDAGGVYLFSSGARSAKVGQLSVALDGENFGVDFNPAANALRVISDKGQNLRQAFGTGDAPVGVTASDTTLNTMGVTVTGVTAAAYTNNDLDAATATTLVDIDTTNDQVSLQAPANAGSLSPTGKLGVNAGPDAGFDIYSTVRNGRTVAVRGFATLLVDGRYRLYEVDILTGRADRRGSFPISVSDIAIPLAQR